MVRSHCWPRRRKKKGEEQRVPCGVMFGRGIKFGEGLRAQKFSAAKFRGLKNRGEFEGLKDAGRARKAPLRRWKDTLADEA